MSRGMAVAGMIILSALSGELSCMKFLRSNHFKINGTSNMPMLQNEDLASVNRVIEELGKGVKACDDLGNMGYRGIFKVSLNFALQHKDPIAKMGRYPGRNKALGSPHKLSILKPHLAWLSEQL